jgi:methyltransferase-like protein/2-polyprenyl-3-methyl-5-hydroxy-6-metoxy-1,4-benzoquinol methylase
MTDLKTDEKLAPTRTSYDELPYDNFSFSYASPEHLYTIGKIFGLNAPSVETAKVLDLGCGFGGNILGFAHRYPKSNSIGIDLSKVQIEDGRKMIDLLGLKNIDLKHMSIVDINESFGKFDYIICHGVFSWVPKDIQEKILEISKQLLTPNGIAYVSYNTLPGWNIISSFSEMLQYHTETIGSLPDKLTQARAFIEFLKDTSEESKTPYSKFIADEASIISASGDSYLKHEYLDKGNIQLYFTEFMNLAGAYGMSYLADASLSTMYLGNLPKKASEELKEVGDIIRSEQYMDFINNRRFRCTLLCHDNINLKRNIESNGLDDMWLAMQIAPDVLSKDLDFTNPSLSTTFTITLNTGPVECTPQNAFICAAFYAFAESYGAYLSMDDIVKSIKAKCPSFSEKTDLEKIRTEFIVLLFKGLLTIRAIKPIVASKISVKPAISKLALMQLVNNFPAIINQLNDTINISPMSKIVMVNLDGESTIDQIVQKVGYMLEQSGNELQVEGKTVTDKGQKIQLIKDLVNNTLQFCLSYGFLVE